MVGITVSVLAFAVLYIYACKALGEAGTRRRLPQRPGDGNEVGDGVCGDKQKGHLEVKEVEVGHGRAKAKRNGDGDGDKALLLLHLAAMDNDLRATDTDTDNGNDADTCTNTDEPETETEPENHTHDVCATEPQPQPPSNPPITITLLHRTARPKFVKKEDIRIVQGSARPFVEDEDEDGTRTRRMGSRWGGMGVMGEKEGGGMGGEVVGCEGMGGEVVRCGGMGGEREKEGEGMGGKEEEGGKEGGKVGEGKGKEGEGGCGGGLGHVFVWTKGEGED